MKKKRNGRFVSNHKNIIKMDLKSSMVQKWIQLSKIEPEVIEKELDEFQKDIKNHGSGIYLWLEDRYANVVLMYSIVGIDILSNLRVDSTKNVVVDEYYRFIADVKKKNLSLYKEEIEKSRRMDFNNTIQPKDLLKKNAYVNYINRRINKDLQILTPQIQAYSEKITPRLKLLFKSLNEKIENYETTENEIHQKKIPLSRLLKNIKTFKALMKEVSPELRDFKEMTRKIQDETLTNLNDVVDDFKDIQEDFKKVYDENTSIAYQKLTLVKDIDSFHIKFTKFVARLFHILIHRDNDFRQKSYIQISPKKFDPDTRNKLYRFLKGHIKTNYPELSKYLLSVFTYNKYRKLDAHENPKVRFENGIAYFKKPGRPEVAMNLDEITKITNTYSYFIEAIRLFQ